MFREYYARKKKYVYSTVDFVIVVQTFACIIFCRVISQQHGGSGNLR